MKDVCLHAIQKKRSGTTNLAHKQHEMQLDGALEDLVSKLVDKRQRLGLGECNNLGALPGSAIVDNINVISILMYMQS
jgi:hypothetical protein